MKIKKIKENGEVFAPATITEAVGYKPLNTSLTKMITTYNLSSIFGSNFSFTTGLAKLNEKLPEDKKVTGTVMGFTNGSGIYEEWIFTGNGYDFDNPLGWFQNDPNVVLELQRSVFPLTVTLTSTSSVIEVGKTTSVTFNWSIIRKGVNVTTSGTNIFDGNVVMGTSKTLSLSPTAHGSKTYEYTGSYAGMTESASKTVTYNHRTYYGIVSATTTSISDPSTLGNSTLLSGKGFTWSGITLNYQKTCYAYPSYFGALSDIKDGNNFSNLSGYTRSTVTFSGTDYYVYIFTNPTTVTGFKQIYS